MWEKKVDAETGGGACFDETGSCANPHHYGNVYNWNDGTSTDEPYNGSVVTVFLEQLNDRCNNDTTVACTNDGHCSGVGGPCGFAGHRDWRLPNIRELQSIIEYSVAFPGPTVSPSLHGASCGSSCTDITDPACACTVSSFYWSATTIASYSTEAWFCDFYSGSCDNDDKISNLYARAVRGGL